MIHKTTQIITLMMSQTDGKMKTETSESDYCLNLFIYSLKLSTFNLVT